MKLTYLKNNDFENSETISKMMTHKIFWNQKPKTDCPKNLKKKSDFLKNEIRKTNLSETKIWKPTFEIRIRKLIKIQNFLETKNRKTIFEIRFSKLQNKIRKRIAKFYETKNRKIDFLKTKPNICDFQNWKKNRFENSESILEMLICKNG